MRYYPPLDAFEAIREDMMREAEREHDIEVAMFADPSDWNNGPWFWQEDPDEDEGDDEPEEEGGP